MPQAVKGDRVKVHYTGKLDDGTVFDSSAGREPLSFVIGSGAVIPGFDRGVLGMSPDETRTVRIPCAQAYGPRDEAQVMAIERSRLPQGASPEVGDRLQLRSKNGQTLVVAVTAVDADTVTLDGNHALAGKDLTFDLRLVAIG